MGGFPNPGEGTVTVVGTVTPADNMSPTDAQDVVGLNAVFDGTNWDRVRAGSPTADPGNVGVLAAQMHVTDGTNISRARSTNTGVDGTGTLATGVPLSASLGYGFNGSSFDRLRVASATTQAAATKTGIAAVAQIGNWSAIHVPATNVQATATQAAGGAGIRHICTGLTVVLTSGALALAAAAPLIVSVIDGASGGTNYLWRAYINIPAVAGQDSTIAISGLSLVGSAATAMTLEFSAAGGANSYESVTLTGYDVS